MSVQFSELFEDRYDLLLLTYSNFNGQDRQERRSLLTSGRDSVAALIAIVHAKDKTLELCFSQISSSEHANPPDLTTPPVAGSINIVPE
jgi:hypothetical protein